MCSIGATVRHISRGTLRKRDASWVSNFFIDGKQIRRSHGVIDEADARAAHERMKQSLCGGREGNPDYYPTTDAQEWGQILEDGTMHSGAWVHRMYQRAKDRAMSRGRAFRLSKSELLLLLEQTGGACVLTGIPFSWGRVGNERFPPFMPVLDRINPTGAYVFSNCRIVCNAANVAMSDWGEGVLSRIALAYLGSSEH